MNESSPDNVNYEDQSAYDVADMVKQFFRDLPEPLLTSKLGETFLHIYQCKHMYLISLGLLECMWPCEDAVSHLLSNLTFDSPRILLLSFITEYNKSVLSNAQMCRRTKGCKLSRQP